MKARKIAAVILAVLVLVSCMPVLGEGEIAAEATVQVTSAPVQITPAPSELPADEATEQPAAPMSETAEDEVTPAPETTDEVPATEIPATEVPSTEAPATEVPATEVPSTEAPATEVPATEAPSTEAPATEVPATEAYVYAPVYANIPSDTELFADKELTEALGELTGSEILYVVEKDAEQRLYMAAFDTEETIKTKSVEIAWFTIDAGAVIEWLTEEEAAAAVETMTAYRKANGELVPYISFTYAETEEEPADEAETDESGLIIETLVAVEPETEPAPETTPEVDESGMIVEELAPVEDGLEDVDYTFEETESADGYKEELPAVEDEVIVPAVEDELAEENLVAVETPAEETPVATRSIDVTVSCEQPAGIGSAVTLSMNLTGYEGAAYTMFWQCDKGAGWETVEGANEASYTIVLDEENTQWLWRAGVEVEMN